jgi:hypothetical protein
MIVRWFEDRNVPSISDVRNRLEEGPANDVAVVHMDKRRDGRHAWIGNDQARSQVPGRKSALPVAAVRPVSPRH